MSAVDESREALAGYWVVRHHAVRARMGNAVPAEFLVVAFVYEGPSH